MSNPLEGVTDAHLQPPKPSCGPCWGQRVRKKSGYQWPGKVVAVFNTLDGKMRIVVECTVPEVAGALHIYSPEQLEAI